MSIKPALNSFLKKEIRLKRRELLDLALLFLVFIFSLFFWNYLRNIEINIYLIERFGFLHNLDPFPFFGLFFSLMMLIGVEEIFIFFLFPVFYWVEEKKLTVRMIFALLFGATATFFLRRFLLLPRPYIPEHNMTTAGPSFPSGHVVQFIMVGGVLFLHYKNRLLKYFFAGYLVFMGFIRLFTGNHFLDDVVFGLIFGGFLIYLFDKIVTVLESIDIDLYFYLYLITLAALPVTTFVLSGSATRHNRLLFYFAGFLFGYILDRNFFGNLKLRKKLEKRIKIIFGLLIAAPFVFSHITVTRFMGLGLPFYFEFPAFLFFGLFASFLWPITFHKLFGLIKKKSEELVYG